MEKDITLEVVVVEEDITLEVVKVGEGTTMEVEEAPGLVVMAQTKAEVVITLGAILAMVKIIPLEEVKTMSKDITLEVRVAGVATTLEGEATVIVHGEGRDREDRGPTLEEEAAEATTPEVPWTVPQCP